MQIKAQIIENGIARDVFIDSSKQWVAVRFTALELRMLSSYTANEAMVAAPGGEMQRAKAMIMKWAREWPTRIFAGTHRAPEGALLLPNHDIKDQDKS